MEGFVTSCFRSGRSLLLIDGFDELTEEGQHEITGIPATSARGVPPHTRRDYRRPGVSRRASRASASRRLRVSGWNRRRRLRFVDAMGESLVDRRPSRTRRQLELPEPLVLGNWLDLESRNITPLELTLKVWAACAGDWQGADSLDAIASHIRRLGAGLRTSGRARGTGDASHAHRPAHVRSTQGARLGKGI